MTNIRPSTIAGIWYPGDAEVLREEVCGYLSGATVEPPQGKIWGILVPHAGYRYSGQIAAYAFKCLSGLQPDLVVVISPFHHSSSAHLLTTAHTAYQTPLGPVAVGMRTLRRLAEQLETEAGLELTPALYDREHSLEIELPFLQIVLDSMILLPIMMRDQSKRLAVTLGRALSETVRGQNVIFVASSDLAHYVSQDRAKELDDHFLENVAAFDIDRIVAAPENSQPVACGRGAIAAVLWACRALGANRVTLLRHGTSAAATGDFASVVGYGAAVIWEETDTAREEMASACASVSGES